MAMFRNVMVYLGLGPDDEYDENYLYDDEDVDFEGLERRTSAARGSDGVRIFDDEDDLGVGPVRSLRPVPDGSESPVTGSFFDGGKSSEQPDFGTGSQSSAASMEHPSAGISSPQAAPLKQGQGSKPDLFESPSITVGSPAQSEQPKPQPQGTISDGPSTIRTGGSFGSEQAKDGSSASARSGGAQSAQPLTNAQPQSDRSSFGMDEFSQPHASAGAKPRTVVPRSFDDAKNVANEYRNGSPVVMNLREADKETGRRLLDFSSGMVYGLGGGMEKLAANVFLITPDGVVVSAEDRRRMEERGYGR